MSAIRSRYTRIRTRTYTCMHASALTIAKHRRQFALNRSVYTGPRVSVHRSSRRCNFAVVTVPPHPGEPDITSGREGAGSDSGLSFTIPPPPPYGLTCLASSSPRIPRQIRHRLVNFPNFPFNSVVDGQLCRPATPSRAPHRLHVSSRKMLGSWKREESRQKKDASLWRGCYPDGTQSDGNDREECANRVRGDLSRPTFLLTLPRRSCLFDLFNYLVAFYRGTGSHRGNRLHRV